MGKQILPIILAFVLGLGLGYVFYGQSSTGSPTSREASDNQAETETSKFKKVNKATASGHVKKYKGNNTDDGMSEYFPVYAVWSELCHVEEHFGKQIKLKDLCAIMPDGATGIRVYEALDDKGIGVNYLVFTDSTQTGAPYYVYNDLLKAVYLIKDTKIDLTVFKEHRHKMDTEKRNNHIVCNPRCPDESLF